MSRSPRRRSAAPSPHHLDPLIARLRTLAPFLSLSAIRRVAGMAETMRDAAEAFDTCEPAHLVEAGFSAAEIEAGRFLAKAALDAEEAEGVPEEAVATFSRADAGVLRRYNAGLALSGQWAFA